MTNKKNLDHAVEAALLRASDAFFAPLAAGLDEQQAQALRRRHGPNEIAADKPMPAWRHLWLCFRNPFNLLLSVLALVSWATDDLKGATVIGTMVLLSTLLRFVQEARSGKAAAALRAMVSHSATVLRADAPGGRVTLPMRDLVPGEVLVLCAGDMIAADCRVLQARDLFVAQAALTGEALPVEKRADAGGEGGPIERANLLFAGTSVASGSALALVLHTGEQSLFGALAQRLGGPREASAFDASINRVSRVLIRFMLVMAPLVLLINGFTKGDWWQAALFALSIAVGLTPEMLPMIVTATLAKGAVFMARRKVIVKRLEAIHNFGAMDVLCTDKTGTLTEDRIALERHVDAWGAASARVLDLGGLNSRHQSGLRSPLDEAVLAAAGEAPAGWTKLDEVPFDFARRRMSVVVQQHEGASPLLVCKGALEEMLAVSTQVEQADGSVLALDAVLRARIEAVAAGLNRQGLRVLAVASRPAVEDRRYGVGDESGLTLAGFLAFLDPAKPSTAPALRALARHGVGIKVLTGDNELVTRKVCGDLGLDVGEVIVGARLDAIADEAQLGELAARHQVFAKLTPAHKERLVRALRSRGHVVGFLGDGINDAPALRAADIGISVDSAVDVAKEAADIILLEKSLLVLEQGIVEGRRTFANMLKYIRMTASSNFGNVFSVLIASAVIPFLPMLPLQLLVQNLLYDVSQIAIPFDRVDAEFLQRPQRLDAGDLGRFMLFFGPLSSLFDIATFALMWFVCGARTVQQQGLFQSGWFVVGLLTQTLVVHAIRTRRIPFVQSRAAAPLLAMTALIAAIGIYLPMGRLAADFELQALPPVYFLWLPAIVLGYMGLTQLLKGWYARRFGWQ